MRQRMQLLCSTGTISRNPDHTSYRQVLEYGPHLDADGFEIMFYTNWYPKIEQIATDLRASSLKFPAMHAEKDIGVMLGSSETARRTQAVHNLAENCRLGSMIGTEVVILHLWGWPQLDDHLAHNLAALDQCLDAAAQYNVKLAIETIPARHADPLTNVQRAITCDGRSFIALDTEFLAQYDQLERVFDAAWLWEDQPVQGAQRVQRVQHVHIKDFDGHPFSAERKRRYLHPGEGYIDFPAFFAGLKKHDYRGNISLESPGIDAQGRVDIRRINESLAFVRHMIELPLEDITSIGERHS